MKITHQTLQKRKRRTASIVIAAIISATITYIFTRSLQTMFLVGFTTGIFLYVYMRMSKSLRRSAEIRKMEDAFPDFIDLMAANLRAGITIDKALLLSSRKEFAPLDREILTLGKDIITGKETARALQDMANRIGSEKIHKTVQLIISGIRSGGNLAIILEETAVNMRERNFVEKRAASNVLMYVIFIVFAVAVGAPILFAFSSVLVEILTKIVNSIPTDATTSVNLPFTLTQINVSSTFIFYFAIAFLIAIDLLASLMVGLVSKGREKEGIKYFIPLALCSITIYILGRLFILQYFKQFFG